MSTFEGVQGETSPCLSAAGNFFFDVHGDFVVFSEKLAGRYRELKSEVADCVLLMQVGAFMHVMDEGARQLSKLTGLQLKMAGNVDSPVVVGGFPKSGLDQYVGKLVRSGYSVAIAIQGEDKERRIVEIVRVVGNVQQR